MILEKFFLILSLGILLCSQNVYSKAKSAKGWGPYEGEVFWKDALKICKSKRMRIPTARELVEKFPDSLFFSDPVAHMICYWASDSGGSCNGSKTFDRCCVNIMPGTNGGTIRQKEPAQSLVTSTALRCIR